MHGAEINEELARAEGIDAHFMAKAQVINESLEECGMGRLQVSALRKTWARDSLLTPRIVPAVGALHECRLWLRTCVSSGDLRYR